MVDFKKFSASQLESFGVASLLEGDSKVYYQSVFSAKHIGQISDLLIAKTKGQTNQELQVRNIILDSLHEIYRLQMEAQDAKVTESLLEPLNFECGLDSEKCAIGVSFLWHENLTSLVDGWVERLLQGKASGRLDSLLRRIAQHAEHVIVRAQPETRRIEIVSLLSNQPGDLEPMAVLSAERLHHCTLGQGIEITTSPSEYIELGDLNYNELLADFEFKTGQIERSSTGVVLAEKATELDLERLIRGERVSDEETIKISNATDHIRRNDELNVVAGESAHLDSLRLNGSSEESSSGLKKVGESLLKLFGASSDEGLEQEPPAPAEEQREEGEVERELRSKVAELEDKLKRFRLEAQKVCEELKSDEAKKWVESITSEFLAEKSELKIVINTMNLALKKKEYEIKNLENSLKRELKTKDDALSSKSNALDLAKGQVAQLSQEQAQRKHDLKSSEVHSKQKLAYLERQLHAEKKQNDVLTRQIASLNRQLIAAQNASQARASGNEAQDLETLKIKFDQVWKQNEQLKRANQLMMERMSASQRSKAGGMSPEELRAKLDATTRVAALHQREAEELRQKVDSLYREEVRLKGELNMVTRALKSLKRSSGDSSAA